MSSRTQSFSFANGRDYRGTNGRKCGRRKGQPKRSLSPGQVLAILRLLALGATQRECAMKYLVPQTSISRIKTGRCYKDVRRENAA